MSLRDAWETRASDWVAVEALREPAALRDDGSPYVNLAHLRGRLLGGGPAPAEETTMPDEPGRRFPLEPAPIHVPDEVLDDLRRRLELTRWPDDAGNQDWYYGVNRGYLQELVDYWRTGYDWRKAEAAINAYEHYRVEVQGVPVRLMRRPGVGPDPTPLILTHGWPWTFWHWAKVVDPLAERRPGLGPERRPAHSPRACPPSSTPRSSPWRSGSPSTWPPTPSTRAPTP